MEMRAHIELGFNWEIGKVTLNELAYRIDEVIPQIATRLLEEVIHGYQKEVVERLTPGHSSGERGGLGRHPGKGQEETLCRGRTIRRYGFRQHPRCIKSKYGMVQIRLQQVECLTCGKRYSPLLDALGIEPYQGHDEMLENAVLDAVIDTNYRRLVEGHNIDISLGGIHDYIAGSDIDELLAEEVKLEHYRAVLADGTGLKKKGGKRGEMRVLVGITANGALEPLGSWTDTSWEEIEKQVRKRIKKPPEPLGQKPLFIYDGEPALEDFMTGAVRASQRCTWHAPRGLYHAMWEDGYGKKMSQPHQKQLAKLVAVEIPEDDYDLLAPEAVEEVREKYTDAKKELSDLIELLYQKNCPRAVEYLKNLSKGLYHQVEMWLTTGIIAPKTTSRLERLFRELGRRLKKIAWGWSDRIATKLSKMIMIKKYRPELWKKYWMKKMGVDGNFHVWLHKTTIAPSPHF